ncbi:hypothetical protein JHK87_040293 [Glycine soja]|nr:hypothetical protein JHK87_040293 [Glycine soja]
MLLRILGFWSTTINGFVLPKAMVAPTLLDVADILNLSIHGKELLSLYGTCYVLSTTIGIKFSKDNSEYSKFMLPNAKKNGVISLTITFDHDLALGPLLFSTLYGDIFHLLHNLEDYRTKNNTDYGPIWNNKLVVEAYYPYSFVRQFGLIQSIPKILSCPTRLPINLCTSCQLNEILAVLEDIEDKLHLFVLKHLAFSPNNVEFFTEWWGVILATLSLGLAANFITRLIDEMSDDELPSPTTVKCSQKRIIDSNSVV